MCQVDSETCKDLHALKSAQVSRSTRGTAPMSSAGIKSAAVYQLFEDHGCYKLDIELGCFDSTSGPSGVP